MILRYIGSVLIGAGLAIAGFGTYKYFTAEDEKQACLGIKREVPTLIGSTPAMCDVCVTQPDEAVLLCSPPKPLKKESSYVEGSVRAVYQAGN